MRHDNAEAFADQFDGSLLGTIRDQVIDEAELDDLRDRGLEVFESLLLG